MPRTARTGPPIIFPAVQLANSDPNTLDDYEEGTWTPVLTFATAGDLSVAYATQVGAYTKVGNLVMVHAGVQTSSFTHTTASGDLQITGLPFTSLNVANQNFQGSCSVGGVTKATYTDFVSQILFNTAILTILASGSAVAVDLVDAADVPTAGTVAIGITAMYLAQ